MEVNAAFIHFLLVQVISLISSLLGSAWELKYKIVGFLGFTIFLYALTTLVAACMAIFRVATWYDEHVGDGDSDESNIDKSSNKNLQ